MGDDANANRHRHIPPTDDILLHRQPLPFLPDELISHILLWLSVRTLLEFKRVCKSWKTIISNPQFAYNHLRNLNLNSSLTHQRLFCAGNEKPCEMVSFPMKPLLENPSEPIEPFEFNMEQLYLILDSCNGLLCLLNIDQGYVKLWNPCIRLESKKSPPLDCIGNRIIRYYGFGYDHVNDKYKVLLTVRRFDENVTQIYIFGENCWTTIQNFPDYANRPIGIFVSGTLNWVKPGYGSNHSVIICFDLEKEIYKEVLLPENDGVKAYNHILGVSSNCLCVCFGSIKTNWNLWVMKKYGVAESWTRLTMIPYEQLNNRVLNQLSFIKFLFILENGIVLLSLVSKFVLLNLNNGRLDECLLGCRYIGFQQHIYYESLVSPQT